MCLACFYYEMGKMSKKELDRALLEMVYEGMPDEEYMHVQEVIESVQDHSEE